MLNVVSYKSVLKVLTVLNKQTNKYITVMINNYAFVVPSADNLSLAFLIKMPFYPTLPYL